MAERAGRPRRVIPIKRWLETLDGEGDDRGEILATPATMQDVELLQDTADPDPFQQVMRLEALEQELLDARREADRLRIKALEQEEELTRRLGTELVAQLDEEVKGGLARLRSTIEQAVTDVLSPFLGKQAGQAASAELLDLIARACRASSEPLVEVKAPSRLQPLLTAAIAEWGFSAVVTEADEVILRFDTRSERFEELAASWIAAIEGDINGVT